MSAEQQPASQTGENLPPEPSLSPNSTPTPEAPDSPGVYFGPFQSPEKKFLPVVARRRTLNRGAANHNTRHPPRLLSPSAATSPRHASGFDLDSGNRDDVEDSEDE